MSYSNYNELFIPISINHYCEKYAIKNHDGMIICTNEYGKWILYDCINKNQTLIELPYNIKVGDIFNPLIININASNRFVFRRFMGYKIEDVSIKYGCWCVEFNYYEYKNKPPTIIITEDEDILEKTLKNNNMIYYF